MESYSKSYSKLAKKAKVLLQDDDNEEEDGPTDNKLPPPDKQRINFREQKAPKRHEWHNYFNLCMPEDIIQKRIKTDTNSQSPSTMIESTPRLRTMNSEPAIQARKPEPIELPRTTLVQTKSSEPPMPVATSQNAQGQLFLGLLQNNLGYTTSIPQQQILYSPVNAHIVGNNILSPVQLVNTTSSFPAITQINTGNIGMNIHLPYQPLKVQDAKVENMYRMLQNGGVNVMEQLDLGSNMQKQVLLQGIGAAVPQFIQNIRKDDQLKKHQTKPVLLQFQGQVLESDAIRAKVPLQLSKRERMETESNFNDIKVKNEGI